MLQATTVFSNVSKGTLAKHEDLVDVFGTEDEDKVCLIILAEGDLQVKPKLISHCLALPPATTFQMLHLPKCTSKLDLSDTHVLVYPIDLEACISICKSKQPKIDSNES